MRSLTSKLVLAFLVVSLLSIGLIVILTHFATYREFDRFISDQYKADLATELARYYSEHHTWDGVEKNIFAGHDRFKPDQNRPSFFSIADTDGRIAVAGFDHAVGDIVDKTTLQQGTPIEVNDQTVGVLLLASPPNRSNPMEDQFRNRLDVSLFFSAIGTIILAFVLGALLSRNLSRPIRELTSATRAMTGNNLGQQVPVRSKDEIGQLAVAFNKMSADLARSFNLRKQMTADIAHELRTPLSLIMGHAEGVHDGVLKPTRENFEIIREEADRLDKLVNDLRILSLADAGELSMDFQHVDVNGLLSDIQLHYTYQFTQKRVKLTLKPAPVILKADLDPARMTQVIANILDNALRYTPEGGRVLITTAQKDSMIEVAIEDNGGGVTAEEVTHLFDRFYRADPSRARDEGGSGLGLAIAKSIVEMHKGKIWAESEMGKGLKVVIQIPMMEAT